MYRVSKVKDCATSRVRKSGMGCAIPGLRAKVWIRSFSNSRIAQIPGLRGTYISLYHIISHPRCLIGAEEEYKGSYTTYMFSSFNILLSCFYVFMPLGMLAQRF